MIKIMYYKLTDAWGHVRIYTDEVRPVIYRRIIFDSDKTDAWLIMNMTDVRANYNWIKLQKRTIDRLLKTEKIKFSTIIYV